jgi:hypothetical protein
LGSVESRLRLQHGVSESASELRLVFRLRCDLSHD